MVWGYFVWMSWHSLDLPSLWADVDPQAPAPKLYCVCRFDPCEMVSVRSLSWAGAHLPQTHGNLPFPVLHHHTRPPPFWGCGSLVADRYLAFLFSSWRRQRQLCTVPRWSTQVGRKEMPYSGGISGLPTRYIMPSRSGPLFWHLPTTPQ